jgi:succinoglycan biosynthesis transport protein ExoP
MTQSGNLSFGSGEAVVGQGQLDQRTNWLGQRALAPIMIRYLQLAVRWRWLIAGIMTACVALGVIAVLLSAPLYTAQSQIEISREKKNVTNVKGVDDDTSYAAAAEFYDTQYQLLRSGSLAERVARSLRLAEEPTFFAAHGIDVEAKSQPLSTAERKQRESVAAGLLMSNVRIVPIRNSSLVNISYTSRSPEWSARIANAWPQAYIAGTMERGLESTADARKFLEGRLDDLRAKLSRSESDLINFARMRNIVTLAPTRDSEGKTTQGQTIVANNLAALNEALVTARTDRITAQSRSGTAGGMSAADAAQNASVSTLRARRADIAAEYAKMLVQFEPGYPAARALKAQLDALDTAINRELSSVQGSRRAAYDEAAKRERELSSQVEALKAQFDQQQRDTIQYNIYQREVDTNRQLYDALLQRYKEIGLSGSIGATNIAIVDPAKVPAGPSAPSLMSYLIMAALAGLALSALAIFALEQIDNGVRSPEEIEQFFRIPLLGNVPKSGGDVLGELADPKSSMSESFQSARAVLSFSTNHGLPTSLLITSAREGEGKSTTAYAMAVAIARTGKRVLLIDADMRSPSVHHMTGCSNAVGFSNLLVGGDAATAAVLPSKTKGLSILPAGPKPPSSAELLNVERLTELLGELRGRFEHVVIDGPPVLGLADAPLLASAVDGTAFVIEAERTPVRAIRHALERLKLVNAHLLGAIVTKIDYGKHRLGYGYDYGSGTGYGYGDNEPTAKPV